MRDLQPEIKRIKQETKGNKQQESLMTMELYKEREIKPLAFIGLMVLQLVIFLALYQGLVKIVNDPQQVYDFSYPVIQNLSAMQELNADISKFDNTLFGVVDLNRAAIKTGQDFYLPAFLLVLGSAVIQFYQFRQTMPSNKDGRKLRDILKEANNGKAADNSEVNAAMSKNLAYFMPIIIFVVTIGFAAALSLYWFFGGLVAYLQQRRLLEQDEYDLTHAEATVISKKPLKKTDDSETVLKESKTTTTDTGVVITTYREGSKKTANTVEKKSKKSHKKKKRR